MDITEANKLIDEVQAVGSARGWYMTDKLLYLIDRVEKIEREACAKVCEQYVGLDQVAEKIRMRSNK